MELPDAAPCIRVEDEDAFDDGEGPTPLVAPIELGTTTLGKLAIAVREKPSAQDYTLVTVMAREQLLV